MGDKAMKKYNTIAEVYNAVKAGEIDESKLIIVLDNDCTDFYLGPDEDSNGNEIDNEILRGGGYFDVAEVYQLLLPRATVEWC